MTDHDETASKPSSTWGAREARDATATDGGAPEGRNAAAARTCSGTTEARQPCRAPPMAGPAGLCVAHAGLTLTQGQRDAAKERAVTHGAHRAGEPTPEDLALEARHLEALADPLEARRRHIARAMRKLDHLERWEHQSREVHAQAIRLHDSISRDLHRLPLPQEAPQRVLDPVELGKMVEAVSRDPEVFLKRLDPRVQEEIRAILRREGVDGVRPAQS